MYILGPSPPRPEAPCLLVSVTGVRQRGRGEETHLHLNMKITNQARQNVPLALQASRRAAQSAPGDDRRPGPAAGRRPAVLADPAAPHRLHGAAPLGDEPQLFQDLVTER